MSEVLEIEVDGEIDDGISGFESERRSPQWGLPAAIGVVGVLLLAVLIVVVIPVVVSSSGSRRPPAHARVTAPSRAAPVEGAQGALAAWGRFAVSGDLKKLDGWLAPSGPQYRILAKEAEGLATQPPGPPAYDVSLNDPTVTSLRGKRATLRGDVTWTRAWEVDQRYRWEIVLHRSSTGRWLLWTVTDAM